MNFDNTKILWNIINKWNWCCRGILNNFYRRFFPDTNTYMQKWDGRVEFQFAFLLWLHFLRSGDVKVWGFLVFVWFTIEMRREWGAFKCSLCLNSLNSLILEACIRKWVNRFRYQFISKHFIIILPHTRYDLVLNQPYLFSITQKNHMFQ